MTAAETFEFFIKIPHAKITAKIKIDKKVNARGTKLRTPESSSTKRGFNVP